jgi:hypothetical protein
MKLEEQTLKAVIITVLRTHYEHINRKPQQKNSNYEKEPNGDSRM